MVPSPEYAERGTDRSGAVAVSIGVFPGADELVVLDTAPNNDFSRNRADQLGAEAAYYRHRARQEEQAQGSGYYVDLLRGMATDRAAMALRLRNSNRAT